MRQFSSQNCISHHVVGYSFMWMQNIAHWEPGGCYSRLLCSSLHQNTQTHTLAGRASKWPKELTSCHQGNQFTLTREVHHYDQWLLSIPYSVKLLPSLKWMAAFRNPRKCGIPWSTRERHSFQQRFSGGQNTTTFIHGTEHIQLEQLKAAPQRDFRDSTNFYKSVNGKLNKNIKHTHTHTQKVMISWLLSSKWTS
jgi:hypothetical protein